MLSRTEIEQTACSIHALRPDWPVASLCAFIEKRKDRPRLHLTLELTYVALDPATKSPGRMDSDGPWSKLFTGDVHVGAKPVIVRRLETTDCRECFRPEADHGVDASLSDHEYAPWYSARRTSMPDPVAAIRAALTPPATPDADTTEESA